MKSITVNMITMFKMTQLDHHIGYLNYIEHWSCEALNSYANGLYLCYALIETLPDCCIEFETINEEIGVTSNTHTIYRRYEEFSFEEVLKQHHIPYKGQKDLIEL